MSDSPYAPPKAVVADVEPRGALVKRPRQVPLAVTCLWIGYGLNFAQSVWLELIVPGPKMAVISLSYQLAIYLAVILLAAWIFHAVGKGRNWARTVVVIFAGIAVAGLLFVIYRISLGMAIILSAIPALVTTCLKVFGAYLLTTGDAQEWYRSMKWRA